MQTNSFKAGELAVHIFDTRDNMGKAAAAAAAAYISAVIARRGEANVVFAAAPSQNDVLLHLKEEKVDWTKVRALHMDEYVSLPDDAPAGFGNFLDRAIFRAEPFKEIHYLKCTGGETPAQAAARYTKTLEAYPPDLVLLGVGENGHLAFNDPSTADFDDPLAVKIVELDRICRMQQVNDGCFAKFGDVPKKAITLSMSALLRIPGKIAVVPGQKKASAVRGLIRGEVTTACPASILRRCPGAEIYLDTDSAALLRTE
ncbi:MAG: 6-phosphogluconolactonase [Oscillospiraceae bacterium]|nr:6-phosphogluconolactonase [Oscillospiraceae bacterium]